MDRRALLAGGVGVAGGLALRAWPTPVLWQETELGPVRSVIPVVGDGKWIWTEPPGETGYLEPRSYSLDIGHELNGDGDATTIQAATPVPSEHPEQKIDDVRLETEGCEARIQPVGEGAAELYLMVPRIGRGQTIQAIAHFRLTLKKQYLGHSQERFAGQQPSPPTEVRRQYLQNSPGIESTAPEVKKLLAQIRGDEQPHPWTLAER